METTSALPKDLISGTATLWREEEGTAEVLGISAREVDLTSSRISGSVSTIGFPDANARRSASFNSITLGTEVATVHLRVSRAADHKIKRERTVITPAS